MAGQVFPFFASAFCMRCSEEGNSQMKPHSSVARKQAGGITKSEPEPPSEQILPSDVSTCPPM